MFNKKLSIFIQMKKKVSITKLVNLSLPERWRTMTSNSTSWRRSRCRRRWETWSTFCRSNASLLLTRWWGSHFKCVCCGTKFVLEFSHFYWKNEWKPLLLQLTRWWDILTVFVVGQNLALISAICTKRLNENFV